MNFRLFNEILATQSETGQCERMHEVIVRAARELGATVEMSEGNVYVTKGRAEVYPTVVAHTDTVHDILPDKQYRVRYAKGQYFAFNHVKGKMTGIGGDDKVGIFVALSMIEQLPAAKAVFFRDEEIGCVGARKAYLPFFADSAFVLECDRNGNQDFIKSIYGVELYGKEFGKAIAPHLKRRGYREWRGAMTDVMELKEMGLPVACANMSCGYYHAHTPYEYIELRDVRRCLDLVRDLCRNLGDRQWPHEYTKPKWQSYRSGTDYSYGGGKTGTWDRYDDSEWWDDYLRRTGGVRSGNSLRYGTDIPFGGGRSYTDLGDGTVLLLPQEAGAVEPLDEAMRRARAESDPDARSFLADDLAACIDCPLCQSSSNVEYDDDVGFFYCATCCEYIFGVGDDDETDARYRVLEASDSDDVMAASNAILREWSAEDAITKAIKNLNHEARVEVEAVPF